MTDTMQQTRSRQHPPGQPDPHGAVAAALAALSEEDLLRLRAVARLRARALPGGISWSDLLQEAVCRALAGARRWPPDVPLIAFLAGIMRSLCHEHWRRHRLAQALTDPDRGASDDPERAYAAAQALAALHRLFAADADASAVIAGLISGLSATEIRDHYRLSALRYDTTRKRIRRAMLRHGLAWSWP